ncbi:PilZ domain-containing protein [Thiomicrorhabdus sp. ZW0627]|uniref:PilZ domain-containing protein n=1 Tax=Thiomicrorhabdus sp. ZW0627 TaxID=3039774 RepID=UPI002436B380|nr:PilZ domain-containing protein [Thiomicrorhabdus sp. ZW0627]MDG6774796.1 PilZ domain-containing protein [Thiomicrorhabdus sp. ZW0627]
MDSEIKNSVKTDRKITLYGRNGQAQAQLVDLSPNWIGVLTARGARIGTELEVEFELPAFEHFMLLTMVGKVTHRHNAGDKIYLAIEFNNPSQSDQAAIEDYINYKHRLSTLGQRIIRD